MAILHIKWLKNVDLHWGHWRYRGHLRWFEVGNNNCVNNQHLLQNWLANPVKNRKEVRKWVANPVKNRKEVRKWASINSSPMNHNSPLMLGSLRRSADFFLGSLPFSRYLCQLRVLQKEMLSESNLLYLFKTYSYNTKS